MCCDLDCKLSENIKHDRAKIVYFNNFREKKVAKK